MPHRTWDRTPIKGRLLRFRVALTLWVVPIANPSEGASRAQKDVLRSRHPGV